MEKIETNPSPAPTPSLPDPVLVVWICPKGWVPPVDLGRLHAEFWRRWSGERHCEVKERYLMEAPHTEVDAPQTQAELSQSEGAAFAENGAVSAIELLSIQRMGHWGQVLNALAEERPWKGVFFLPVWQNPDAIAPDIFDWLTNADLDGVTFYREGSEPPFTLWMWRSFVARPFAFLLEIPWQGEPDWLGWKNWLWERTGAWVFGVKNRDPLFPCRAFRGSLFRQLALQSGSAWIWMEMLAKLHFIGARLSERRLAGAERVSPRWDEAVAMSDVQLVLRAPQFRPCLET